MFFSEVCVPKASIIGFKCLTLIHKVGFGYAYLEPCSKASMLDLFGRVLGPFRCRLAS